MVMCIRDIVDGCDTNAQGAIVKDALLSKLRTNTKVEIDFTGVFNVTSSFVNTAFIELIEEFGVNRFKSLVSVKNANRQIASLVKSRVASAGEKEQLVA